MHALLGIQDLETLLSNPVVGASWEGFVIENLLSAAPDTDPFPMRGDIHALGLRAMMRLLREAGKGT